MAGSLRGWRRAAGPLLLLFAVPPLLRGGGGSPAHDAGGDPAALWVLFDSAAASADALPPALGPEALAARAAAGLPLSPGDRPLPRELVARVAATGVSIRHESRWLRAVSVSAGPEAAARLERLPGVRAVRPVGRIGHASSAAAAPSAHLAEPPAYLAAPSAHLARPRARLAAPSALPGAAPDYGLARAPLTRMNVPAAHDLGYTGSGLRIAILDTGFDPGHESLVGLPLVAARDFIGGDAEVRSEPGEPLDAERHGTWIWSLAASDAPGELVGPAFGAEFILAKVDDILTDPRADEDRWIAALEWADSLGARIVISAVSFRRFDGGFVYPFASLTGDAALITQAADEAARRGILVVNEVGDGGPADGSLAVPADGDSVLAVGAVDSLGRSTLFSARGPTADGRIKPDLAAPGTDLFAASATDPTAYERLVLGGTGLATALAGGAAALVWEAWPAFGPMDVREALMRSGSRAHAPDNAVGHGVPDVGAAILFPLGFDLAGTEGVAGDGVLTSLTPRFAWDLPVRHAQAGPVTFVLELASDSAFQDILFSRAVADVSAARLTIPLAPGTTFFWRVQANTLRGVQLVSAVGGPLTVPRWVRLLSPNASTGSQIDAVRPRLVWSALDALAPLGPLTFDVEILSNRTGQVVQRIQGVRDTVVTAPDPLPFNEAFTWRVIARAQQPGIADTVRSAGPFVVVSDDAPPATLVYQNFPNPFPAAGEDSTRIWFDLERRTRVELTVHDLRGRLVARLTPAAGCGPVELDPGLYGRAGLESGDPCVRTTWDGRDDAGRLLPPGVYLLRFRTSAGEQIRRMVHVPR